MLFFYLHNIIFFFIGVSLSQLLAKKKNKLTIFIRIMKEVVIEVKTELSTFVRITLSVSDSIAYRKTIECQNLSIFF